MYTKIINPLVPCPIISSIPNNCNLAKCISRLYNLLLTGLVIRDLISTGITSSPNTRSKSGAHPLLPFTFNFFMTNYRNCM